jgi:hypothetical protein
MHGASPVLRSWRGRDSRLMSDIIGNFSTGLPPRTVRFREIPRRTIRRLWRIYGGS